MGAPSVIESLGVLVAVGVRLGVAEGIGVAVCVTVGVKKTVTTTRAGGINGVAGFGSRAASGGAVGNGALGTPDDSIPHATKTSSQHREQHLDMSLSILTGFGQRCYANLVLPTQQTRFSMLKSLILTATIGVSTLASANAFAMTRSELWYLRYTLQGQIMASTGYTPSSGEGEHTVAQAERALADRGENRPTLTVQQAQDLAKDCLSNCRDVTITSKIIVSAIKAIPGGKPIIEAANDMIDGLDYMDARNCWQKVEDAGNTLPDVITRRYFPERFGGGPGTGGSGCQGAGGCPW